MTQKKVYHQFFNACLFALHLLCSLATIAHPPDKVSGPSSPQPVGSASRSPRRRTNRRPTLRSLTGLKRIHIASQRSARLDPSRPSVRPSVPSPRARILRSLARPRPHYCIPRRSFARSPHPPYPLHPRA
ncbi:uncharacterized protein J3D65DRAFT_16976 [Phyllosticta citribraziliensis]|uniref:Uncharacterized protein n=1 Tax=Phyllosticta citribraziliensis TaxID=989973 RepID=A0ABR1M928_9PEZI